MGFRIFEKKSKNWDFLKFFKFFLFFCYFLKKSTKNVCFFGIIGSLGVSYSESFIFSGQDFLERKNRRLKPPFFNENLLEQADFLKKW